VLAKEQKPMKNQRWMNIFGAAILTAGGLLSTVSLAASDGSDGYSIEDFRLSNASDLLDVCTVESGHADFDVATAFCYGFIEGTVHYDDAVAGSEWYRDIVCSPADVTRTQAVTVITDYIRANPQHGKEKPVDAIFRALIDQWPCPE
jgi:Ssp1 endopeptidase immunity protein Rap1a